MKKFFINNESDDLLLFFSGWGCDEYEFEHIHFDSDVLILYDYTDLELDFDFSKYKKIDLAAFSAGVFVASVMNFNFEISSAIAISGNPYLFDAHFGISSDMQNVLCSITAETADDFARKYLIKTKEEWEIFRHSNRDIESCRREFHCLKKIYEREKSNIIDIYDIAISGDEDEIFNYAAQREFYGDRLQIVKNARHNLFFKIKNFSDIYNLY